MSAGDTYQLWWQGTESLSLCGIPVTDHTTLIQGGKEMAGMEKLNDQLKCQIINRPNQDPRMPDNRVSAGSRCLNFLEILALHLTPAHLGLCHGFENRNPCLTRRATQVKRDSPNTLSKRLRWGCSLLTPILVNFCFTAYVWYRLPNQSKQNININI